MKPDLAVIKGNAIPKTSMHALSEPGRQYAIYLCGDGVKKLAVNLPADTYRLEWIDTQSGPLGKPGTFQHAGGVRTLEVPDYRADIGLGIRAQP